MPSIGITELLLARVVGDQLKKFTAPIKSLIKTHVGATIYHSCILKTIKINRTSTNDEPIYAYTQKLNKAIALESLAIVLGSEVSSANNPQFRISIEHQGGGDIPIFQMDNSNFDDFFPLEHANGISLDFKTNPLYLKTGEVLKIYAWESNNVESYAALTLQFGEV